mgnify:FL=1
MKLQNAYFFNNERSVIRAIYLDSKDQLIEKIIPVQESNGQYRKFIVEMEELGGIDGLHERTFNYLRETQEILENQVIDIAKKRGLWSDIVEMDADFLAKIAKLVINDDDLTDEKIFKLKLKLFEQEIVTNSTDRQLKSDLRKATTFWDVLAAYRKFKK